MYPAKSEVSHDLAWPFIFCSKKQTEKTEQTPLSFGVTEGTQWKQPLHATANMRVLFLSVLVSFFPAPSPQTTVPTVFPWLCCSPSLPAKGPGFTKRQEDCVGEQQAALAHLPHIWEPLWNPNPQSRVKRRPSLPDLSGCHGYSAL